MKSSLLFHLHLAPLLLLVSLLCLTDQRVFFSSGTRSISHSFSIPPLSDTTTTMRESIVKQEVIEDTEILEGGEESLSIIHPLPIKIPSATPIIINDSQETSEHSNESPLSIPLPSSTTSTVSERVIKQEVVDEEVGEHNSSASFILRFLNSLTTSRHNKGLFQKSSRNIYQNCFRYPQLVLQLIQRRALRYLYDRQKREQPGNVSNLCSCREFLVSAYSVNVGAK